MMECPLCGNHKTHKHGKTSKGTQRYYCPVGLQTFTETFDTLYYRRQIQPETGSAKQVMIDCSDGQNTK